MFQSSNGISGCGFSKFALGKIIAFSSIKVALMTAARPLEPSKCPILDFTEPSNRGFCEDGPDPKISQIARASIGSPIKVPV